MHTVDSNSEAASPGQIEISKSKYLDYAKLNGIERIKYNLLFSLSSDFLFKWLGANKLVFDYIKKKEQFRYGCINPTIVVDKSKGLIATFTNLSSNGYDIVPVVKISKEPLELIRNIEVLDGQKLPTVALYLRNTEDEFARAWVDFTPKIVNCFTDDLTVCNEVLSRVSSKAWECLELGLVQVINKTHEGLHYVKMDKKLVQSAW